MQVENTFNCCWDAARHSQGAGNLQTRQTNRVVPLSFQSSYPSSSPSTLPCRMTTSWISGTSGAWKSRPFTSMHLQWLSLRDSLGMPLLPSLPLLALLPLHPLPPHLPLHLPDPPLHPSKVRKGASFFSGILFDCFFGCTSFGALISQRMSLMSLIHLTTFR